MEIPVKIFPAKLITSVVALVKKTGSTWIYMDLMIFFGLPMVRCDGIDRDLLQFGLC
jgi:hypothetical protein